MLRHIKIFSHDSQTTEEIIKLLNTISIESCDELKVETIEDRDEIHSYCIERTPSIMLGCSIIHEGSIPTKEQILEWLSLKN